MDDAIIRCENLVKIYKTQETEVLALQGLELEVARGELMAIIGNSGSGKSTLLKLFMRFWETQQGEIALSHTNVNRINTQNLREMESFVTQETHLFHDSIRRNLCIAKLDATQEELEDACRKALCMI